MTAKSPKAIAAERRRIIRRMLDLGRTEVDVHEAFASESSTAIRRDLAAIRAEDVGKHPLEMSAEKIIRLAQEQLGEESTPPTARAKALEALQKAELDLMRARGQIAVIPGKGIVVSDAEEWDEDAPDEDDEMAGRPPVEFDDEYHRLEVEHGRFESVEAAREDDEGWCSDHYGRNLANYARMQFFADLEVEAAIARVGEKEYFRRLHEWISNEGNVEQFVRSLISIDYSETGTTRLLAQTAGV